MSTMSNVSHLAKHHHDDYDRAKAEIFQQLGSYADIEVFGRQVLVACYVRPSTSLSGLTVTSGKGQTEDIYQGKAVLILKCGPGAFKGDDSYQKAMFGDMPIPAPGDWMFQRPQDGVLVQLMGDGAEKCRGEDRKGEKYDLYPWDGWPCRIVTDESFIGRMNKPHTVV